MGAGSSREIEEQLEAALALLDAARTKQDNLRKENEGLQARITAQAASLLLHPRWGELPLAGLLFVKIKRCWGARAGKRLRRGDPVWRATAQRRVGVVGAASTPLRSGCAPLLRVLAARICCAFWLHPPVVGRYCTPRIHNIKHTLLSRVIRTCGVRFGEIGGSGDPNSHSRLIHSER